MSLRGPFAVEGGTVGGTVVLLDAWLVGVIGFPDEGGLGGNDVITSCGVSMMGVKGVGVGGPGNPISCLPAIRSIALHPPSANASKSKRATLTRSGASHLRVRNLATNRIPKSSLLIFLFQNKLGMKVGPNYRPNHAACRHNRNAGFKAMMQMTHPIAPNCSASGAPQILAKEPAIKPPKRGAPASDNVTTDITLPRISF